MKNLEVNSTDQMVNYKATYHSNSEKGEFRTVKVVSYQKYVEEQSLKYFKSPTAWAKAVRKNKY